VGLGVRVALGEDDLGLQKKNQPKTTAQGGGKKMMRLKGVKGP